MADTNFKFCTACGHKVGLDAKFCAGCGAALGAKDKSVQVPTQKASAVAQVKKETAPTQKGLTAREWNDKGDALAKSGRDQEAIQYYDKALKIDPNDVRAWELQGLALSHLGRDQEALQCYDRALAIDPKDVNAWILKGARLIMLNRHREAIQCYDRALAIDPKDAVAQNAKLALLETTR